MLNKNFFIINNKQIPLIRGGKGGCFAAGTQIATLSGFKNIENISVGDYVLCFDENQNITSSIVTETFIHEKQEIIKVSFWDGNILVTPNHWVYTEHNSFLPIGLLTVDDALIDNRFSIRPITNIELIDELQTVYNFTVDKYHTYIANNILVHNKGGGKSQSSGPVGGNEAPNTLFSTDLLYLTIALGEGPLYRINPNGLQDIEINEATIDDLLNLDTDGTENQEFFHVETRTGTLTQTVMPIFGEESVVPQALSSPIVLKKGNIAGIPRSDVTLQNTSVGAWDALRFVFNINSLYVMDTNGNTNNYSVGIRITIYDNTGTQIIGAIEKTVTGKTTVVFRFTLDFVIPDNMKSSSGYKFSIEKISDDSDLSRIQDSIAFVAWQEIENEDLAYPRTALIGYAVKAANELAGTVPTFTCLTKGLICKVPNNYNQPILSNGDIDWREVETTTSGQYSWTVAGYRLQKSGSTVLTSQPVIYMDSWDGNFTYSWTQNPVWILYDLLTNRSYGLGIPEENIDKWRFYRVAQYCDSINPQNGTFIGVDGYSDGTFRYKPRNTFTAVKETLIGIPSGNKVKERRFICDISIATQTQVFDLITHIAGIFRGVLFYSGSKLSLNVDMPDEVPAMTFTEADIEKNSISISGIKESEILTGVEVSYIEPNNHYRREVIRIDDPQALKEQNQIENISQIDLAACTRRGQAIRFAQYLLASSKYIRRKISFTTTSSAINLTIGDVIAVSQRLPGTTWGFGGRVFSNAVIGNSNIFIEHYTSPAITSDIITNNTLPLALRVVNRNSDRIELYLISNTNYSFISSGNTITGADVVQLNIKAKYKYQSRTFSTSLSEIQFAANNIPVRGDTWTFGEMNPNSFYTGQNDKLFKITGLDRDEKDFKITIHANEYISNVYTDSDTLISYIPVRYKDTVSPLIAPPTPYLDLFTKLVRTSDGSVRSDIEVYVGTDTSGYPIDMSTEIEYAAPAVSQDIEGIN